MNYRKLTKGLTTCVLTAALLLGTAASAGAAEPVFSDVARGAWYYGPVTNLAGQGVVSGYTDGTFRPDRTATAGEALKLVLTACGNGVMAPAGSHWASGYLSHAVSQGLVDRDSVTDADASITRGTAAKLLVRTLGLTVSNASSPFIDTADPYAVTLYRAGLVSGSFRGGKLEFRPQDPISRAELCAIIDRMNSPGMIQYGSYQVPIAENLPRNPYDPASFRLTDGRMTYSGRETATGIDVSYYQEDIDWRAVKNSGIDFVMIRLGYRGYETGKLVLDSRFREYISGATAAGLDVGIYFFSQAITVEEAREEARFVLSNLQGYSVTYPVVFDWEIIGVKPARTDDLDPQLLTAAARAFCDTVAAAGYTPAIYFTKYLGYVSYDIGRLGDYDFWFAEYTDAPSFYYGFDMWQYTDRGSVPGISGRVDMNICFKSYN